MNELFPPSVVGDAVVTADLERPCENCRQPFKEREKSGGRWLPAIWTLCVPKRASEKFVDSRYVRCRCNFARHTERPRLSDAALFVQKEGVNFDRANFYNRPVRRK